MIYIEDDILLSDELQSLDFWRTKGISPKEYCDRDQLWDLSWFCDILLERAEELFNFETQTYEFWTHANTRPLAWHYDKDEDAWLDGEENIFPLCSIVFYPIEDEKLMGGKLLFENGIEIIPKRNRVVMFSPGLLHSVQPFRGERISYNINPWPLR